MSLVKRLVGSRPFQRAVGVMAAEYLRLVWTTTGFVVEPEGICRAGEAPTFRSSSASGMASII